MWLKPKLFPLFRFRWINPTVIKSVYLKKEIAVRFSERIKEQNKLVALAS